MIYFDTMSARFLTALEKPWFHLKQTADALKRDQKVGSMPDWLCLLLFLNNFYLRYLSITRTVFYSYAFI